MFMIIRIVVVLPAPLGPSRPNMTPFGTENDRSSTARNLPKDLETFVSSMAIDMVVCLFLRKGRGGVYRGSVHLVIG